MAVSARNKHEYHSRMAERWRRGAEGEEATAAALAALPSSWVVIHDVAWPGRKLANIDHVAIGPAGVFVIDSKNWSGQVRVEQGVLRLNRYNKAADLRSAVAAAEAVAALIPEIDAEHVRAVLCFSGDVAVDHADGVLICSTENLVPWMAAPHAVGAGGDRTADRGRPAGRAGLRHRPRPTMGDPITLAMPRPAAERLREARLALQQGRGTRSRWSSGSCLAGRDHQRAGEPGVRTSRRPVTNRSSPRTSRTRRRTTTARRTRSPSRRSSHSASSCPRSAARAR